MPEGGAPPPAEAPAGPPPAGPPAGPPAAGPGGPAGGAPAAVPSGALAGCNPAQQGELYLFDCAWGVALYGPGAKEKGKAAREAAIEGFVGTVLQGSQMKVEATKSAKLTLGGKTLKGRHVAVKNPQPPHAVVAEGLALYVSDAPDSKIMACLKAKEDKEKDRCEKVFEGFLESPPP